MTIIKKLIWISFYNYENIGKRIASVIPFFIYFNH